MTTTIIASLLVACAGTRPVGIESGATELASAIPGTQILLTLPQKMSSAVTLGGEPGRLYLRRRSYGPPPAIDRTLDELAKEHGIERVQGWAITSLDVYCEVFQVPGTLALEQVMEALAQDPRVDLIQPMNVFETLGGQYDDPYADLQPAISQLGIQAAHLLATGKGVRIAVIDSAIDASHPELKGHIDISRDLVTPRRPLKGGEVHGTAVAGVIASTANNGEGIVGVAPDVQIAALRACRSVAPTGSAASCSSFSLAQALDVALSVNAAVINLSLSGPSDPLLSRLLGEALRRGIVVVAAEAEPGQRASFPASQPGVIVVRSASSAPAVVSPLALAAPGNEILTTVPGSAYAFLAGSSLAAAHVSGVIALLMELSPSLDTDGLAALLAGTAAYSADGISINACAALEQLTVMRFCAQPAEVASY